MTDGEIKPVQDEPVIKSADSGAAFLNAVPQDSTNSDTISQSPPVEGEVVTPPSNGGGTPKKE